MLLDICLFKSTYPKKNTTTSHAVIFGSLASELLKDQAKSRRRHLQASIDVLDDLSRSIQRDDCGTNLHDYGTYLHHSACRNGNPEPVRTNDTLFMNVRIFLEKSPNIPARRTWLGCLGQNTNLFILGEDQSKILEFPDVAMKVRWDPPLIIHFELRCLDVCLDGNGPANGLGSR